MYSREGISARFKKKKREKRGKIDGRSKRAEATQQFPAAHWAYSHPPIGLEGPTVGVSRIEKRV